ncbi:cyclic nucleotide-gated ion channel 1-like isoform X2 [Mangifera indica]|uniref:cyclic nucleotide-gated ion channel 1-like isoform X2 n=1 Tax=Mangifera indica TaxID=29780 RepID=UPI001CFA5477|nr:cyclic nucleotide-gated ion channel 1-like isoform X2 [Mangifera indica]
MSETQLQAVSIEDGEKEEIIIADDDPRGIWQHLRRYLKVAINFFDLDSPWGYGAFLTAYMIVIFVHPLHYYAYVIDSQHNCLEINNELYATFAVVAIFNAYMLLYVPNVIRKIFLGTIRKEKGIEHFMFTQVPVLLMTLTILPDLTRGTTDKIFLTTTNLFLFGYMLLVIGLSITIRNASKQTGFIAKAKWAKAVFNLLLYLHGGHVFGATWYCFAIDRILVCWRDEYNSKNTLKFSTFVCGNHDLEKLSCHKTANITHFGIFNDGLEYRIVGMKSFLKKYLFCFRWGLQVLSCFGQNLRPSTFPLENIYVISVIIYSTLLFVFLIGNMQTYLQSTTTRLEEMRVKRRDAEQWMAHRLLPDTLRERIRRYEQYKWQETRGVDEEYLLCNLPKDLRRDIKRHLCLALLMRVPMFEKMDEQLLDAMCDCLKPVLYTEESYIVREGDPVDEMLFIMRGKLLTITTNGGRTGFFNSEYLGAGDFCGEELLTWALDPHSSSNLPISTRTVRALAEVEAFALKADDLKFAASQFRRLHSKQLRHTFRFYSQQWRTWAACFIQAAWRRYSKKKLEESLRAEEDRLQDALSKASGNSPGLGATIYASRFAANALRAIRRNSTRKARIPERVPPILLQKPAEPDFTAEEQ